MKGVPSGCNRKQAIVAPAPCPCPLWIPQTIPHWPLFSPITVSVTTTSAQPQAKPTGTLGRLPLNMTFSTLSVLPHPILKDLPSTIIAYQPSSPLSMPPVAHRPSHPRRSLLPAFNTSKYSPQTHQPNRAVKQAIHSQQNLWKIPRGHRNQGA